MEFLLGLFALGFVSSCFDKHKNSKNGKESKVNNNKNVERNYNQHTITSCSNSSEHHEEHASASSIDDVDIILPLEENNEIGNGVFRVENGFVRKVPIDLGDGNNWYTYMNVPRKIAHAEELYMTPKELTRIKSRFIAIDTETTGLAPVYDNIVEIGAVLFEDGVPVKTFDSLVNPLREIPPEATEVNHITNEMISNAPSEKDVFDRFANFLEDAMDGKTVVCAHNAEFDIEFLLNTFERLGRKVNITYADTLFLSRRYIENLKCRRLASLAKFLNIKQSIEHRAKSDALTCGHILVKLFDYIEDEYQQINKLKLEKQPSREQLEVCAVIYKILKTASLDTSVYCFYRDKSPTGYCHLCCGTYQFLSFRFLKKGKYIIIPNKFIDENLLITEPCKTSDRHDEPSSRVYFCSPNDLFKVADGIIYSYQKRYKLNSRIQGNNWKKLDAIDIKDGLSFRSCFDESEAENILESICSNVY